MAKTPGRGDVIRDWLTRTFSGRALTLGVALKAIAWLLHRAIGRSIVPGAGLVEIVDSVGDLALVVAAAVVVYHVFGELRRVVLWRVRRKLTLSYIFIGFVPALLIIVFFLLAGLLLFFNISAYSIRTRVASVEDQAQFLAQSAAIELGRDRSPADARDVLVRRHDAARMRYPGVSYAIATAAAPCDGRTIAPERPLVLAEGPWDHVTAPAAVPAWVTCAGFEGLIAYRRPATKAPEMAARAVSWIPGSSQLAVVVDIPIGERMLQQIGAEAGVTLGEMAVADFLDDGGDAANGRRISLGPANVNVGGQRSARLNWVAILDHVDWNTGGTDSLVISFTMSPTAVYERISGTPLTRLGNLSFGQALLVLMAIVGGLFLVIQLVAFGMGLALARSITGAIHELFEGTELVGRGDFTHRIPIRSRDQLGELAASFNSMTTSIEYLLQEKAEKERLEQELRIARAIQQSLLPRGALNVPGVTVTPHCEPAREVGGDYYDYLPLDEHRVAVLIADVSGKGTSAALYMAELKGIILSLSEQIVSPRELLIRANALISRHLDTRSFITITYAVVDLHARTLTYARAGHCPLIHVPGPHAPERSARVLMADGMVLGLQIDNGETFDRLLEESTVPLGAGDLILLYTDGLTETMNGEGEYFGETRLGALVQEHAHLPTEELRERILREIRAFAGSAVQQDDMTMLLLRVDAVGAAA